MPLTRDDYLFGMPTEVDSPGDDYIFLPKNGVGDYFNFALPCNDRVTRMLLFAMEAGMPKAKWKALDQLRCRYFAKITQDFLNVSATQQTNIKTGESTMHCGRECLEYGPPQYRRVYRNVPCE